MLGASGDVHFAVAHPLSDVTHAGDTAVASDTIAVGFIGAGSICTENHLPGLQKLDGVEVLAVCNRSRASGEKVAAKFHVPHVEEGWRKLIARDDLDAVFIGTWPYTHKDMSIATLEAGKHCFCQARMAMNVDEARQMLAAAKRHADLVNMISPCPFPMELYIRHAVKSGMLGQITSFELKADSGANMNRSSVTFRERRELSGNQALAMGIFSEALIAIFGPYASLSAQTAITIDTKTDDSGRNVKIDVPQTVTISGQLASGALGVEHHTGLAVDTTSGVELTIWGLEGTLRSDFSTNVEMARPGEALKAVQVPPDMVHHWNVESDFIGAVRAARAGKPASERPVRPDFAEGLLYMQKVEAVHRSAATGQAVRPAEL